MSKCKFLGSNSKFHTALAGAADAAAVAALRAAAAARPQHLASSRTPQHLASSRTAGVRGSLAGGPLRARAATAAAAVPAADTAATGGVFAPTCVSVSEALVGTINANA
jgi:hypothetical protein